MKNWSQMTHRLQLT